mmetsp:Transcript_9678/g.11619  ORF Transcript_9678/g.11619 Transcript_9678/m.11619 type:complete len:92 (-) Transcript_9678:207-482(-)
MSEARSYNRSLLQGSRLSSRKSELRNVNTRKKPLPKEKLLIAQAVELYEENRREFESMYVDKQARRKFKTKSKMLSPEAIARCAIEGEFRV